MATWEYREVIVSEGRAMWYDAGQIGLTEKVLPHFDAKGWIGHGKRHKTIGPLLAELGHEGWEMVASSPAADGAGTSLYFKRPAA